MKTYDNTGNKARWQAANASVALAGILAQTRGTRRADGIRSDAGFSRNGVYRYWLTRSWNPGGKRMLVVGLNPSRAGKLEDDPTIRKCIGFAKRLGFGHLCMVNMFAFVSTDQEIMHKARRPIGQFNNYWLQQLGDQADLILAAWGEHSTFIKRVEEVMAFMPDMHALHINKDGSPRHPLYVPYSATLLRYVLPA